MAGFLVVWAAHSMPLLQSGCSGVQAEVVQAGHQVQVQAFPGGQMLVWRRSSGEFPLSGTLQHVHGHALAWLGQCVEDSGDATQQALEQLAQPAWQDAVLAHLNGSFAAVSVSPQGELRLLTDRYRHYPIYLYQAGAYWVASSEMRCIWPFMPDKRMSHSAIDMLLRSGELIDRMTLLEGVDLLPPATVLTQPLGAAAGTLTERRYWQMQHQGHATRSFDDTAVLLADTLSAAVKRQESAAGKLGITLSGGLDSRIILDLCRHPEQVPSFTWGLDGCRDIACATEFAQRVGSPHTVRHWQPEAFPPLWGQGVALTAGSFGVESMYMLPFIPLLSSHCDVVLNGLAGDAILGGNFIKREWLGMQDLQQLGRSIWRWRVSPQEDVLVDGLMASVRRPGTAAAGELWAHSIAAHSGARPIERVNDWLYENRVFRNTNSGTMLLRSGVESHAPFFDRDFVDAVTTVKQEYKFKHRLYLDVMRRIAPRSAATTWQRTQIPPGWGYHANLASMALHRVVNKVGKVLGVDPFPALKVADPGAWMRGPWRSAVQDIVLGASAQQRGLWSHNAAQALWQQHLHGANHTRQLGAMVAVELFAQQALDGVRP
ncbi:hypothetical protein KIK84_14440 [Curvibacter sp. CHRR-16]|uniref:asparagine synthase-related protein n=1 Tax=Curvibacter sp. CHRR-16 TaxID=2835872 RepID=UPI001BDB2268|nr:asparagine synthetase B family protein [Curvibacter sp. CHRR-16]MBT0571524.1 hypothetical protein [Curvibacter sp. CHRR-16]